MLNDDAPLVRLPLPGAVAATSLRGAGSGLYGDFNVCHYVGDDNTHVMASRHALARYFGVSVNHLVIPRQTHSALVRSVDGSVLSADLEGVDGLVTATEGLVLCINTADCVPVLMVDDKAHVIAAVHSGWRGTVQAISAIAVNEMCRLGAVPHRIKAVMGPCIGPCCFEVGPEVAAGFISAFPHHNDIVLSVPGHRDHIDLGMAIRSTLESAGLLACNISAPVACSHCNGSPYFSARRSGIASGRTVSAIMLTSSRHTAPLG